MCPKKITKVFGQELYLILPENWSFSWWPEAGGTQQILNLSKEVIGEGETRLRVCFHTNPGGLRQLRISHRTKKLLIAVDGKLVMHPFSGNVDGGATITLEESTFFLRLSVTNPAK